MIILAMTLLACCAVLILAQTGDDLFRQARNKEVVDGDIPGAIQLYERIVRDFSANRALTAQALLQLGECHSRLNETDRSQVYFQRVVDQFKDQTDPFARASARLTAVPRSQTGIFIAAMDPRTGAIREPVRRFTQNANADESGATWSPDGRFLSYRRAVGGQIAGVVQTDTYVRLLNGGTEQIIHKCGTNQFGHATWLPDGQGLILFGNTIGTTGCLGVSDVETGQILRRSPFPNMPGTNWTVLSADAVTLYATVPGKPPASTSITVTAFNFATLEAKSSFVPIPLEGETMGGGHLIDLSPDGRVLAVIRSGDKVAAKLVRISTDFQNAQYRELVAGIGQMQGLAWSKDSRRIFFGQSVGEKKWRLMQVSAEGGVPSFTGLEVIGPLRYFDVNRDNSLIAFDGLSYTITH